MLGSSSGYPHGGFTPGWSGTDLNHKVVRGPWQNRDKTLRVGRAWVVFERKADSPKFVENLESGGKPREAWEAVVVLVRQAL
jgi:hypothetical protein